MAIQFTNLKAMWRKPYYSLAGVFRSDENLDWIPSANWMAFDEAAEAPDGSRITFSFPNPPAFIQLNGQWLIENHGYTRSGSTVTFPFAPVVGDVIRSVP